MRNGEGGKGACKAEDHFINTLPGLLHCFIPCRQVLISPVISLGHLVFPAQEDPIVACRFTGKFWETMSKQYNSLVIHLKTARIPSISNRASDWISSFYVLLKFWEALNLETIGAKRETEIPCVYFLVSAKIDQVYPFLRILEYLINLLVKSLS